MSAEQIDLLPCPFCGGSQSDGTIEFAHDGKYVMHNTFDECSAFEGTLIRTDQWNRRASPVNAALAEDAARAHDLALEVERLRQRAEAAERERDTAKKYMAAYEECDWIGTEAYRDLADQHDALRKKVSDMEAAWLVAHGVDLDSAMVAVQSVNATALTEARAPHAATAAVLSARDSIPE